MTARKSQSDVVPVSPTVRPRLLNLRAAALYLSVSTWSVRDYALQGVLPYVQLPPRRPKEGELPGKSLRRVLFDQADLDAFIERRKVRVTGPGVGSGLPLTSPDVVTATPPLHPLSLEADVAEDEIVKCLSRLIVTEFLRTDSLLRKPNE